MQRCRPAHEVAQDVVVAADEAVAGPGLLKRSRQLVEGRDQGLWRKTTTKLAEASVAVRPVIG